MCKVPDKKWFRRKQISMADLSTSSLDMISDFFKAFIANNSRVFLYSAKMTYNNEKTQENMVNLCVKRVKLT